MKLFQYCAEHDAMIAEIGGIKFCCEEVKDDYENRAEELSRRYQEKLPNIVNYMLDDICSMYGDVSEDELTKSLGAPLIDLDRNVITYLEQTLDDCHIFGIEFDGFFERFYEVVIDG